MRSQVQRFGAFMLAAALLATSSFVANAQARPWLGVVTQSVDRDLRESLDLDGEGVLINRVVPDSPADRVGLRKGDVILSFDGETLGTPDELVRLVGRSEVGERVSVVVLRNGTRREFTTRLVERPDETEMEAPEAPEPPEPPTPPSAPRAPEEPKVKIRAFRNGEPMPEDEARKMVRDLEIGKLRGLEKLKEKGAWRDGQFDLHLEGLDDLPGLVQMSGRGRLGVRVESLTPDMASALGSTGTRGALVLEVLADTPAEKAGIKAGDIITEVNGKAVYETGDIRGALPSEGGDVSVELVRRGVRRTVEAAVESAPRAMRWHSSGPMGLGRQGDDRARVLRRRLAPEAPREELRDELRDLREQLRELREQLEEMKR